VNGRINRISRAENRARTPPSLFGMARRMAYSHRKYHSGLMWIGVTRGFAIRKFSGSANMFGVYIRNSMKAVRTIVYPSRSLMVK